MAEAVYDNGIWAGGTYTPFQGLINFGQGMVMWGGIAHFTTTATTCTISPRGNCKRVLIALVNAITASVVILTVSAADSSGIVTVTRSDTTSNGAFYFLAIGD